MEKKIIVNLNIINGGLSNLTTLDYCIYYIIKISNLA